MASEQTIYVTSTASSDIFSNNTPSSFSNRLGTPIVLDSNVEHEIGLVSILYPNQYYAIKQGDGAYSISINTFFKKDVGGRWTHNYIVKKDILAGDLKKLVKIINQDLMVYMLVYFGEDRYRDIFAKDSVMKWNDTEEKVELVYVVQKRRRGKKKNPPLAEDIENVNVTFSRDLALLLGFKANHTYPIYGADNQYNIMSDISLSPNCGVDYVYLYTDVIQPTHFGGGLVNILHTFALENGGNKGIYNTIYKPLNSHFIDQISILITDQNGNKIHFKKGSTVTCVLHIRQK